MSKRIRFIASVLTLLFLITAILSGSGAQSANAFTPLTVNVGLVPTAGGIDDNGYNALAYAGLLRAEDQLDVIGHVYQPANPDEDYAKLAECAGAGNALCISVGFEMGDATITAAGNFPGVNFATVDMDWPEYPSNLRGLIFNSAEVGYLAGTLAALMSNSHIIGVIGGMNIPPVNEFIQPYQYGAEWANPQAFTIIDYANDFSDPEIGAQFAQEQISRGADVIFGVGGMMGNGAILEAAAQGKWVIGVDTDVWYSAFGEGSVTGSEFLLTSAMKRADNAVFQTIEDQVNGTFTSGKVVYDLSNGGVGLAPYHDAAAEIPLEVQEAITNLTQGIIDGEVDVWEPFYTFSVYLPLTQK